jgi:hypothetical protein
MLKAIQELAKRLPFFHYAEHTWQESIHNGPLLDYTIHLVF